MCTLAIGAFARAAIDLAAYDPVRVHVAIATLLFLGWVGVAAASATCTVSVSAVMVFLW